MSRALVLGGGGPVGIGWEAGLTVGLKEAGVVLADADLIVGTSAGSVVGAQLALGADMAETVGTVAGPLPLPSDGGAAAEGMATLLDAMAKAATDPGDPVDVRKRLGEISRTATTVDEETFIALFAQVDGLDWPEGYACTAIDIDTGELQIWNRAAAVPLERAVASSCSVPAIFPPVTINGRRYMDGGMKTALNADVAAGHDVVVAVSCFTLELPEGMSDPAFDAMKADTEAEFDVVRAAGATLEVITPGPEMLDISGWGLNLMDQSLAQAAYAAGVRQAADEADRLRAVWS